MDATTERPLVSVRGLGGTVAMTADASLTGVAPRLDAAALVDAVPALRALARVDARSLCTVPSASLEIGDLLGYLPALQQACESGSRGVVVTLGTDTMEEVAYLFDLVWDRPEPLVLTGAMRAADAPGADGPANLLAAVTVAVSPHAAGHGVLVVMGDEIHAARWVRKLHTSSPAAFGSPAAGPLGRVHEGTARLVSAPAERRVLPLPAATVPPRVALLRLSLGDDPTLLERAVQTYDGIVVEAYGGGHVPATWVAPLVTAARRLPVVLASRTGAGPLLHRSYDFPGSERELLAGGLLSAGQLDGLKARILLTILLAPGPHGRDPAGLADSFARLSGGELALAGENA